VLARPKGFEPLTPRFVGWPTTLIAQQNFANRNETRMWRINGLRRFCNHTSQTGRRHRALSLQIV